MKPRRSDSTRIVQYLRPRGMRLALLLAAMSIMIPFAGIPAFGGDCTIAAGKVDLDVLFLYNETDLEGWKPVFTEASKLLYNATEGNLQFGKVNFFVACQPAQAGADFWVSEGTGGASAHVNGCGKSGWHVFVSNIHKRNDATAHGQLGMVHELGHYIFNLRDEYGGQLEDSTGATVAVPVGQYMWRNSQVSLSGGGKAFICTQETGGSACLMDGGTTVTGGFSRTEFCSDSDHIGPRNLTITVPEAGLVDESSVVENNQEASAGEACWRAVAAKLGLTPVPNPPSTDMPAGHEDVVFNDIGAASRFVLCLDRSGSMSGSRIDLARTGAKDFVTQSRLPRTQFNRTVPGDEVGVVSFSSTASVNATLDELVDETDKVAVRNSIDAISAGGTTSIGGGLRTSLDQLIGRGTPGCIEAIVLLSDGFHNSGESPASVIPDIVARGAVVFSIGVGAGADSATLGGIATSTGGKFFFAGSASDLPAIFTEIQAIVTGAPVLERVKRVLEQGTPEVFGVNVDSNLSLATFHLTGSDFTSMLISPSGEVSTPLVQAPGVTYDITAGGETYAVNSPDAGAWMVEVIRTGAGFAEVNVVATAQVANLEATQMVTNLPESVNFFMDPDAALLIEAAISEGPVVGGATVMAEVSRPDGSAVEVPLMDNGDASNGDDGAQDGVYAALFDDFAGDGVYNFVIRADTTGGYLIQYEDGFEGPPVPATPASRVGSGSVSVAGVPEFVEATVEYGPETLNLKSRGRFVTAYIELPEGVDPARIAVETVNITEIDGSPILPIPARPHPTELGDFDDDGVVDLMVKFDRTALQAVLSSGTRVIRLEGIVDGDPFLGDREIWVIQPGR